MDLYCQHLDQLGAEFDLGPPVGCDGNYLFHGVLHSGLWEYLAVQHSVPGIFSSFIAGVSAASAFVLWDYCGSGGSGLVYMPTAARDRPGRSAVKRDHSRGDFRLAARRHFLADAPVPPGTTSAWISS